VASAFCVVSVLSGSVLAEDAQERSLESAPVATASVDASVTPYAYADEATPVRDVAAEEQAGAKAKSRPQFNMSQVERIRVRLWGNTELGGEYAIDPDNSLSIPRVGRIAVDGLTLADLELLLTQKLSTTLRTDVTVAVEVARFRPYYIMGQVAESGAIECWRGACCGRRKAAPGRLAAGSPGRSSHSHWPSSHA
jgi:polysaccharide export outer membrane protein